MNLNTIQTCCFRQHQPWKFMVMITSHNDITTTKSIRINQNRGVSSWNRKNDCTIPMRRNLFVSTTCLSSSSFFSTTTTSDHTHDDNNNPMNKKPSIGFIGLGNMGLSMSLNIEKVFPNSVIGYDTNQDTCHIAQSKGLIVTESIEQLVKMMMTSKQEESDKNNKNEPSIIFTMVPNDTIVDNIMKEMIQYLPDHSSSSSSSTSSDNNYCNRFIFVDCSTISPITSRKWNQIWKDHGHWFFDAPVSGGAAGAEAGTLTFMVGTKVPPSSSTTTETKITSSTLSSDIVRSNNNNDHHDDYDSIGYQFIKQHLSSMGKQTIECGKPGAGSVVKLCNNLALASQMIGICEAFTLCEMLDCDPEIVSNVMNVSTAKCWSNDVNIPHPIVAMKKFNNNNNSPSTRNYQGGFSTSLILKDLSLALDVMKESSNSNNTKNTLPMTSLSKDLYQQLIQENIGWDQKDFGIMFQYLLDKQKGNK